MAVDAERHALVRDTVRSHAVESRQHAAVAFEEGIGQTDETAVGDRRVGGAPQGQRNGLLGCLRG